MLRRDFLKLTGTVLAYASTPGILSSCLHHSHGAVTAFFPQGIASGDPRPDSVVIWTRVEPAIPEELLVVTAEVSLDSDFDTLVLQESYEVSAHSDHTLRIIVRNLQPDTYYYYRFLVGNGVISPIGRTLTAPLHDDMTEINFAFVSCQERLHGFYGAYRQMINEDVLAAPDKKLRFIVHLGDFVYETLDDPLQTPLDDMFNPIEGGLIDSNGVSRRLTPFPDGSLAGNGVTHARTLADYRHLYKEYLRDPDLQAARARWPFIHIWDDHEFSDDSWQSEANYNNVGPRSSTDEPSQPRKVAANQAWYEFMPVNFINMGDTDADLWQAYAFSNANVGTSSNRQVDDTNFANNADNVAAIGTMAVYRSFRFGQLMELVLTDNRSYRSDHSVPEDISGGQNGFIHPRMLMPVDLVNSLDAGRNANNSDPDAFIVAGNGLVANPRFNSPPGTMLGATQKSWWKETMQRSRARWKLWGNSVPLMRFLVDLSALDASLPDVVMSTDSWDGYPSERKELMAFLRDNGISNVVSLSGDLHAHFAGVVMDDYDSGQPGFPRAVMTELVCSSISSVSMFAAVESLSRRDNPSTLEQTLRGLITFDSRGMQAVPKEPFVNNLNNTLLNGVNAGIVAMQGGSQEDIKVAKDETVNRHLVYADTDAHGYGLISVTETEIRAKLITIDSITRDGGESGPGVKRVAAFTIPDGEAAAISEITEPAISGVPPFPH